MTRLARAAVLSLLAGFVPLGAEAAQMGRATETPVLVVFFQIGPANWTTQRVT